MGFLFLSHSNADDVAAEAVRDWLIAQGHDSIFLDHHAQDGIVGGEVWEERLYTELRRCRALAALLSRSGSNLLGAPLTSVMPRRSRRESYRSWLPASMKPLSTIAFRPRFAACRLLTGAMRTLKNGFARRLPVPVLIREAQAFGEGIEIRIPASRPLAAPIRRSISAATRRSPIFWRCSTRAARRSRLVLVQGASGTGKSSLVQAGLLPRLEQYPERWLVLPPFRPAREPLAELASVFELAAAERSLPARPAPNAGDVGAWARWIVDSAGILRTQRRQNDCTVLITIDQLEETLGRSAGKDDAFLLTLRDALDGSDFRIVGACHAAGRFSSQRSSGARLCVSRRRLTRFWVPRLTSLGRRREGRSTRSLWNRPPWRITAWSRVSPCASCKTQELKMRCPCSPSCSRSCGTAATELTRCLRSRNTSTWAVWTMPLERRPSASLSTSGLRRLRLPSSGPHCCLE